MSNIEKFREVYTGKLLEAIARHPEEYFYGPDKAPGVVDKMIAALAVGGANLSSPIKAAARALGIKPTMGAIKTFLNKSAKES